ncbi:DMT family transporter [Comamonas terrigena]|uniref:EamA/RhaT family transporter n=1 Tax=Comamonas terrigena TaxID=32013 RepID=A0A2A7UST4_COMTR|nr:DMT family transporter [Comamonas terrigena]PEH88419.1 EamA/RhaT family transporter [Comamonas terrigena]BBL23396.1 hypothetical protein CT3_08510 [Comamonas terrigena NBRC 13299]SUY87823.1 Uncharacterized conserved small protein [Comamonas terrigena]
MTSPLTLGTAAMLTAAPLLWAGNAIVGRMVHDLISPFTLNFLRWVLAFALLLPWSWSVLRRGSALWPHWRRYALLGLVGIGCYNALLYLALQTSSPINVTLVGSSMPVWMLVIGRLCFGARISLRQMLGAALSVLGVAVVLSRGDLRQLLSLQLVPGDLFVLLATILWSLYSWMLADTREPTSIRGDWAGFLMAQLVFGLGWSALFASGELALGHMNLQLSLPLAGALLFIALGPAILAYRFWGVGVSRAGPAVAGFFANLIPVFTAILSTLVLAELPHVYHGVAFHLIVGGIVVSSRR